MHTKETRIKICGIKNEKEVHTINQFPVDYIGFIFAKSKRQIDMDTACKLKAVLREDIKTVGVFVDENVDYILESIQSCGLNAVQLHGDTEGDLEKAKQIGNYRKAQDISLEIFKSISVKDEGSVSIIPGFIPYIDYVLLDAYSKGQTGGTGKTFNWDIAKGLSGEYPLILAGGLNPDNIIEAIKGVKPYMVDVNSGVETELIKDETKIRKLFKRLKEEL